eukprot:6106616-Pleurochrysis_carterae.AAC.2
MAPWRIPPCRLGHHVARCSLQVTIRPCSVRPAGAVAVAAGKTREAAEEREVRLTAQAERGCAQS